MGNSSEARNQLEDIVVKHKSGKEKHIRHVSAPDGQSFNAHGSLPVGVYRYDASINFMHPRNDSEVGLVMCSVKIVNTDAQKEGRQWGGYNCQLDVIKSASVAVGPAKGPSYTQGIIFTGNVIGSEFSGDITVTAKFRHTNG